MYSIFVYIIRGPTYVWYLLYMLGHPGTMLTTKTAMITFKFNRLLMILCNLNSPKNMRQMANEIPWNPRAHRVLIIWGQVTQTCIANICHHWFRLWLVTCSAPSHYLNQKEVSTLRICKMRVLKYCVENKAVFATWKWCKRKQNIIIL